jgi:predicted nuclease of restriction endonuclease-like (RecB) superfamily
MFLKMEKLTSEYKSWLIELKSKIRSTQIKAAVAVNSTLIKFYLDLGKIISEKDTVWGSKFLETLSRDLQSEFPEMKGFSTSNLKTCKLAYQYFGSQPVNQNINFNNEISSQVANQLEISPQVEGELFKLALQIPWGHIKMLIGKIKDRKVAKFYIQKTIENNWSRDVLDLQIKSDLYNRQGKSINNFKATLPEPFSDLANQTLKDPYIFDFLTLAEGYKERDIEKQLVQHITKFLLELGKGFAFIGQQYHLQITENDYYIDLLFYHTKLKCYVVI